MSLFGSLQTASNTLQAMQIGLQVVGNNIANANTEGFIREKVNYVPAPPQQLGNLTIGLGVQIDSITQVIDEFLGEQLRGATGDYASAQVQDEAYKGIERLLGELGDNDLSTALTDFFGSIEDTLNSVSGDALSVRNLAVLEGSQLTSEIRRIEDRAKGLRDNYDAQVQQSVGTVNQLTEQIAQLNVRITQVEGGSSSKSDAGALRASRNQAVNQLTELVSATVSEQPSGGLSISVGGEFLVFEGQRRDVAFETGDTQGESAAELVFVDTGKALNLTSGKLQGLAAARDEIVDGFREGLDEFAATLIHEFNRAYSQGQGIEGFKSLTSVNRVDSPTDPIDAAGLAFAPENGQFNITVLTEGGAAKTATIKVNVLGDGSRSTTTLAGIASQINSVDGLSASVDSLGRLAISGQSDEVRFTFSNDSSGFLASIGLNTFFTGSGSSDIGINGELNGIRNASKLALARASATEDALPSSSTENAILLAEMIDKPLESLGGGSIIERYDQLVNELAQNSTVAGSVSEGLGIFEATLANEFQAISGVNIDEEAIDMISLQRIYQATARVIATIQEMLDTLVRL
ncbi:Flagellar hook-associated protein 1 [Botrimarina colliarenosi]|uniref:Flagellar hook-associated protein 1 n=1 Tax=Botrimarina colliarenosi TaxID=2528001 RepID=A0A5C6AMG4_9BACT|nr:flagellar hook-associated protein FlgK [Botrimarina colliarenosi]TWT99363.1 Flagellar hook-associated protein 1 [Botrimarina colliarenosi]